MANTQTYSVIETLKDGTRVRLRAVRCDDGPKIHEAFRTLNAATIATRFFGQKADVSDAELRGITDVDFARDVALLVTLGTGSKEIVIGGVSAFALDSGDPPRSAELAFTVVEAYRARGIAGLLMRHIIGIARDNGLLTLEADIMPQNLPMLRVVQASGLPLTVRHDADVVHVVLAVKTV